MIRAADQAALEIRVSVGTLEALLRRLFLLDCGRDRRSCRRRSLRRLTWGGRCAVASHACLEGIDALAQAAHNLWNLFTAKQQHDDR
jgi:hypothetical protein